MPTVATVHSNIVYQLRTNAIESPNREIRFKAEGLLAVGNQEPDLRVDPPDDDFFAFDPIEHLSQNRVHRYYLQNHGIADLIIDDIVFSPDVDLDVFELRYLPEYPLPYSIIQYEDLEFRLALKPQVVGVHTGEIWVYSNDQNKQPYYVLEFMAEVYSGINEEIAKIFDCKVSPNPANDDINIEYEIKGDIPQNVKIDIVDETGSVVLNILDSVHTPASYIKSIPVSSLSSGSYYVSYTINEMTSAIPLVIAR